MGEFIYDSNQSLELDSNLVRVFSTIRELGGIPLRLLARIDARHLDSVTDRMPSPSEVWMALHAERGDRLPPDVLAT